MMVNSSISTMRAQKRTQGLVCGPVGTKPGGAGCTCWPSGAAPACSRPSGTDGLFVGHRQVAESGFISFFISIEGKFQTTLPSRGTRHFIEWRFEEFIKMSVLEDWGPAETVHCAGV
jgi:hypothetical protein